MQVLLLSCRISVERQVNFIKSFEKLIVLLFAGSAHIHGVLFLDLDKIVDNEVKEGNENMGVPAVCSEKMS